MASPCRGEKPSNQAPTISRNAASGGLPVEPMLRSASMALWWARAGAAGTEFLLHNGTFSVAPLAGVWNVPPPAMPTGGLARTAHFRKSWFAGCRLVHGGEGKRQPDDLTQKRRDGACSQSESGQTVGSKSAGWTYKEACTLPNLISLSRALSAPLLGACIVNDAWQVAIGGTMLAGFSDWLDGYLAKKGKQESSLGSYLDPLADKVLVTCLTVAAGYKGLIDPAVCGIIVGRDAILLGGELPRPPRQNRACHSLNNLLRFRTNSVPKGAFLHRAHVLNWRWKSWREYFRVTRSADDGHAPVAPSVKPIFISKLNTVFQIVLVVGAISNGALGIPNTEWVEGLGYVTAATTLASGAIYVRMYSKGQMLT